MVRSFFPAHSQVQGAPDFFEVEFSMEGTIKFFNEHKGYGIVQNEAGSWFFTGSAIIGDPVAGGDEVFFDLADDPRRAGGLLAVNVRRTGSAPAIEPCRLFIANLPWKVSQAELHDCFERVAPVVNAELILDRETGKSRGFAFIAMETEAGAREAIAKLNGADWGGRTLTVRQATRSRGSRDVEQG